MIEYTNVRRSHFICTEHNAHDEAKLVCIFQIQCHWARKTYSESSFQPFVYLQKELITSKGILTTLLFFLPNFAHKENASAAFTRVAFNPHFNEHLLLQTV